MLKMCVDIYSLSQLKVAKTLLLALPCLSVGKHVTTKGTERMSLKALWSYGREAVDLDLQDCT
jgi:hypothetical protein